MRKLLKRWWRKPQKKITKEEQSPLVAEKHFYEGLSKNEMVARACKELDRIVPQFTSKMVFKYLDGLVALDRVYKSMHHLTNKGYLKKLTVLTSDDEIHKYNKMFYQINKENNGAKYNI